MGDLVRSELRRSIRKWNELKTPLSQYVYFPKPAGRPSYCLLLNAGGHNPVGQGLRGRASTISLPDERIQDLVYDYARCIWHLRESLREWCLLTGRDSTTRECDEAIKTSDSIRLARNLITLKKHPRARVIGEGRPEVGQVDFDLQQCGEFEFFWHGPSRQATILVSEPRPVPFRANIEILTADGERVVAGDAALLLRDALRDWMPFVEESGVLAGDDPDASFLREAFRQDGTL